MSHTPHAEWPDTMGANELNKCPAARIDLTATEIALRQEREETKLEQLLAGLSLPKVALVHDELATLHVAAEMLAMAARPLLGIITGRPSSRFNIQETLKINPDWVTATHEIDFGWEFRRWNGRPFKGYSKVYSRRERIKFERRKRRAALQAWKTEVAYQEIKETMTKTLAENVRAKVEYRANESARTSPR